MTEITPFLPIFRNRRDELLVNLLRTSKWLLVLSHSPRAGMTSKKTQVAGRRLHIVCVCVCVLHIDGYVLTACPCAWRKAELFHASREELLEIATRSGMRVVVADHFHE